MIYDILFVGATTLACAWAEKAKNEGMHCILCETGGTAGYDYGEAWYSAPVELKYRKSSLALELSKRNALNANGIIHLPAVAPILCGRIKESGVECLFYSRVIDVKKTDYGFDVKIFAIGKEYVIKTKRIADTTAEFSTRCFFGEKKPKYKERVLSVLLENTDRNIAFSHYNGCFGEGIYCKIPVNENENYPKAVLRAVRLRNSKPDIFGFAKIVHFPFRIFEKTFEKIRIIGSNAVWMPSQHYDNAVEAYEAGINMADAAFADDNEVKIKPTEIIDDGEYDTVVAGLGVAGSVAAVYAAKRGMRVLGIENMNFQGGMGTGGAIYYYYQGEHKDGFYREIDKTGHILCDDIFTYHPSNAGGPRKLVALEENFRKYNVNAAYNATVIQPVLSGEKTVRGLIYRDDQGLHRVFAKQVIDATADGIVCRLAGCEMTGGRWCDNNFTPFSTVMQQYITGKNTFKVKYYDCGIINQYNIYEFSKAIIKSNSDSDHLPSDFVRDETIYMGTVPLTGLREGEHIVGELNMEISQVLNGEFFDNPAFYMVSIVDAHTKDFAFEEPLVRDWFAIAGLRRYNLKVPVPAQTLIPKDWNGLLAAGRHLATDHSFSYALRMMDDMCRSAETAVLLAEYAIKTGDRSKNMPYDQLKRELLRYKCLKESDAPGVDKQSAAVPMNTSSECVWLTDIDEIERGLRSDSPGYAMWSARMLGKKIRSKLCEWLKSENKNLSVNCALVMAMCGFYECEDVLLEALNDKSGYIPATSNSFIVPRIISVIAACGSLGLEKSFDKLYKFFTDEEYVKQIPIRKDSFFFDDEDINFQFRSFAFMAIVNILKKSIKLYDKYADVIRETLLSENFTMNVTSSGSKIKCDLLPTARKIWSEAFPDKRINMI